MRGRGLVAGVTGAVAAVSLAGTAAMALGIAAPTLPGPPGTVNVSVVPGPPDLFPGTDSGDLHFVLTNPNDEAVTFTDLQAGQVTSERPQDCPAEVVSVRPASGLSITVAGRSTSAPMVVPDVVSMARWAPESCQGVGFKISIDLQAAAG